MRFSEKSKISVMVGDGKSRVCEIFTRFQTLLIIKENGDNESKIDYKLKNQRR
jgi:hypothetical protein